MAGSANWKDWIDGPLGYALRGATYGGGLGWIYDKANDKNGKGRKAMRRIATGALLGSLAGSAWSNYRETRSDDMRSLLKTIDEIIKKSKSKDGNGGK